MTNNSMLGSLSGCDCNDYSKQTAVTGMATISTANTNINGSGAMQLVLTGSLNGTHISILKVVATQATTAGMVRFFIQNPGGGTTTLYLEVPIPPAPATSTAVVGSPVMSKFEASFDCDLDLPNGYKLYASTQNAETFNVFALGYAWEYPGELPSTCCNFIQYSAAIGIGTVSTANTHTDGTGTIVPIYTSGAGTGSYIESIAINALQSTTSGMIRLFISADGGVTYSLFQEIWISEYILTSTNPTLTFVFNDIINYLQGTYVIGASTQLNQTFAIRILGKAWTYPI